WIICHSLLIMLNPQVCCCVWWVGAARRVDYDTMLDLSTETPSLSAGNEDIHRRSLSPWTWRMSTVPTRIPSTIWEAECSSSVCQFSERQTGDGTEGLNAVPIYQDVLVLLRKPGSGCFTSSFRRVAVGCTCVRALSDTSTHLS
uniref:Uncharacterized protein n=1 Tax=Neogobius melanostomus TaxID=47308 RepID=A0A8C6TBY4_9GOBI